MATIILCLSIVLSPVDQLRSQTEKQIRAMTNIQAEQLLRTWGKYGQDEVLVSKVMILDHRLVFDGRDLPLPRQGVQPGPLAYGLLHGVLFQPLEYRQGSFSYSGTCPWKEHTRRIFSDEEWIGFVPCEGSVFVDHNFNVTRITQRFFPGRIVKEATVYVDYDWVKLKDNRLMPIQVNMLATFRGGQRYYASATWSKFQEFRASEPVVTEVEP